MTDNARPKILVLEGLGGTSDRVWEAGATALEVAPYDLGKVEMWFRTGTINGMVLTGGGDVHPSRYGQDHKHTTTYGINETRDKVELGALTLAAKYDVPVLGICRGSQIINVHNGGTLWQNITDRRQVSTKHRCGDMLVNVARGTRLSEAIGTRRRADTIHLHHQAVRRVGRGLRASAFHRDGTIEAIESVSGRWILGTQFHPEMARADEAVTGVFRALVYEAAQHAGVAMPDPREMARYTTTKYPGVTEWPGVLGHERVYDPEDWEYDGRGYYKKTDNHGSQAKDAYTEVAWDDREWCHICRMDFDWYDDYSDHMHVIHGLRPTVLQGGRAAVLTRVPTYGDDSDPATRPIETTVDFNERKAITTGRKVT